MENQILTTYDEGVKLRTELREKFYRYSKIYNASQRMHLALILLEQAQIELTRCVSEQ